VGGSSSRDPRIRRVGKRDVALGRTAYGMSHFMALAFGRDHAHLALGSATVEAFGFLVSFALPVQFGPLGLDQGAGKSAHQNVEQQRYHCDEKPALRHAGPNERVGIAE
jgi:hypothetical protein